MQIEKERINKKDTRKETKSRNVSMRRNKKDGRLLQKQEVTVLGYFADLNDYASYQRAGRTPRDLLQMWKDCFDCLYEEGETDPKFMMWGNHPFVGGRPFRAQLLREFIRYAKSHAKVW